VNPDHMQIVDSRTNTMRGDSPVARHSRKTHCKHGHEFTSENTIRYPSSPPTHRICRKCDAARQKLRRQRRKYLTRGSG
jgi:hypothetical protein